MFKRFMSFNNSTLPCDGCRCDRVEIIAVKRRFGLSLARYRFGSLGA
jgi:hypothetical protein